MKFRVNKIAAAVAVSLGTSVVGMNAAQADQVLFPYVVMGPTVTTLLSVINDDDFPTPVLHYRYFYNSGSGPCSETDYTQPTSGNDIVTYDVSGHFGDAKAVLFEPSTPYPLDFAKVFRSLTQNQQLRAFAIIDNDSARSPGQGIEGEAFIIQFSQGAVWGYEGYNAADIVGWDGTQPVVENPFDFSDHVENNGEVLVTPPPGTTPIGAENYWVPVAIMPFDGEITTRFFVTPISKEAPSFQLSGTIAATIGLQVNDPFNISPDVMYDRDELAFSGQRAVPVTCVGAVDVPELINQATQQNLKDSGGWSNVGVRDGQAVVMKLEFNDHTPSLLDGKLSGGDAYNNGFWLRKGFRESVARVPFPGSPAVNFLPVFAVPKDQELNAPYPLVDIAAALKAGLDWPPAYGADATPYAAPDIASTVQ
jgi:hypothetical protein